MADAMPTLSGLIDAVRPGRYIGSHDGEMRVANNQFTVTHAALNEGIPVA
jgi:hypothetical protein